MITKPIATKALICVGLLALGLTMVTVRTKSTERLTASTRGTKLPDTIVLAVSRLFTVPAQVVMIRL